jgi:uncharacterized protein YybS (DUF2232 family)
MTFLQLKAWDEAEPILRESLAIRQRLQPDAWTIFNTKSVSMTNVVASPGTPNCGFREEGTGEGFVW